jgi:hypothetical protein
MEVQAIAQAIGSIFGFYGKGVDLIRSEREARNERRLKPLNAKDFQQSSNANKTVIVSGVVLLAIIIIAIIISITRKK